MVQLPEQQQILETPLGTRQFSLTVQQSTWCQRPTERDCLTRLDLPISGLVE
jgi:hypothetical protein